MGNGESREGEASKADQKGESEEETSRSKSVGKAGVVAGVIAVAVAVAVAGAVPGAVPGFVAGAVAGAIAGAVAGAKAGFVAGVVVGVVAGAVAGVVAAGAAFLYFASGDWRSGDWRSEMKELAEGFHTRPKIKILTYNVWPREDIEVHKRMEALGDLILQYSPEVICFQEVTPYIYKLFQNSTWWNMYKCSLPRNMVDARPYFCMQMSKLTKTSFKCKPFNNSIMGEELLIAEIDLQPNKKLTVATTLLKIPNLAPPNCITYSKERVAQAKESIEILQKYPNVVFGGDMNWNDTPDGFFPLMNGWIDAWEELKRGENGWTYDTVSNKMLTGGRKFRTRLDRFVCCLKDFRVVGIEIIGKDAIPGASYVKKQLELPVLPSDHYGLLLTVQSV